MPMTRQPGHACYYRLDGLVGRPVIVLAHALGLDHAMWDEQAAGLAPHVQVLRYDIRGHGASAAPSDECRIGELGADMLALADALDIERFAFCGISLGGMIGQWLAVHVPERLTSLVLANTTPRVADPSVMDARRRKVLHAGMSATVEEALERFFSPAYLAANGPAVVSARRTLLATDPAGYAACCGAVRDFDLTASLTRIRAPTLVISGDRDVSMPWEGNSAVLADRISDARVVRLPAAHLSNLERPRTFTAALMDALLPPPEATHDAGMIVRRAVLGDAHVDRAIEETADFTHDFQELITRTAWGTIWARPGLGVRTRRLLVLTVLATLGRWEEFRMHVRTGLVRELEPCDLEEVLLQVAVYAGVPAANTGFRIATEELTRPADG